LNKYLNMLPFYITMAIRRLSAV